MPSWTGKRLRGHRFYLVSFYCYFLHVGRLSPLALSYKDCAEFVDSGAAGSEDYSTFMGTLPPGEEGEGHSHAGYDSVMDEIIVEMGRQ